MRKLILQLMLILVGTGAQANGSKFEVKVIDLTNLARSTALEACGTAKHIDGKRPLLVTLVHDQSSYSTLTDESGNWCMIFKRWNNIGKIAVKASLLDFSENSEVLQF